MRSPILKASSGPLAFLIGAVSLAVLVRGHNLPGGGFIGGLLMAGAFALYASAAGPAETRRQMRVEPQLLVALGLALVVAAALIPLALGDVLLQAQWWVTVPVIGKLSSVLLFDTGVYLVVWGTVLVILLALFEEEG